MFEEKNENTFTKRKMPV